MTTIADNIGSSDRNLTATCRRAKPNYFVPLSVSVRYSVKMMITPFTRDLFRSEVTYEQNIISLCCFLMFYFVYILLCFDETNGDDSDDRDMSRSCGLSILVKYVQR